MDHKVYWLLTKFLVPLGLTTFVTDIAEQVLNRGLSSAENATEMLATFGIAYSLTKFAAGPFEEFKNVSLVLVHNKKEAKIGLLTLFLVWIIVLIFGLLTAYTDFGYFITHTLYSLDERVGEAIRKAILMLSFFPLFQGLIYYIAGYILQMKYTALVGTASVTDVAVQIATIFGLLQTDLVNTNPVLVPIIAVYTGATTRLSILFIGFLILRRWRQNHTTITTELATTQESNLSVLRVLKFWWPIAVVRGVQTISRTIINLFVARDLNGSDEAIQAVAVLSIVYPIGRLPFGWINDLKTLQPSFLKKNESTVVKRKHIKNFDICCLLLGFAVSSSLFWIPGIVVNFYTSSLGVSEEVAQMCVIPLKIFSVFPLLVGWRSHNTSWLLLMKKTTAIFPSAIMRLVILIVVLNVFPKLGIHGAPLGIAALLSGFAVEALSVQIAAFVVEYKMKRSRPPVNKENGTIQSSNEQETTTFINGDTTDGQKVLEEKEEDSVEMNSLTN
ncbi:progressive ankylosis protein homolog isoform X1 [Antedon mediterranea]|uniref:progressive ankylosis protein homolog isoform X1 n=1 Tax=Antedon mediterranea TaxID=105859 RepID=UPI003AF7ED80